MVDYIDLLYSIVKELKKEFPKYNMLINANEEAIYEDSFYVRIIPVTSSIEFSKTLQTISIIITFINPTDDIETQLKVMQRVEKLFIRYIPLYHKKDVIKRYLPIFSKDYSTNNKIQLVLNYYEDNTIEYDSTYDALMEIINMNVYINNKQAQNITIERKDN